MAVFEVELVCGLIVKIIVKAVVVEFDLITTTMMTTIAITKVVVDMDTIRSKESFVK